MIEPAPDVEAIERAHHAVSTHCPRCARPFSAGYLDLGTRRGARTWRYCIRCNVRGPSRFTRVPQRHKAVSTWDAES